ncbi:MAG TPA: hypothetical protein VN739_09850 [Nitrososphaerales archaeon]|nr:hypothetical protein [Nitrososphaerales archaeon]
MTRIQYKWVALSVTTVGTVMAGVDARIVLVGLPTIAEQLHAGVADVIWVSQAYLFASTLGLLLTGERPTLWAGSRSTTMALSCSQLVRVSLRFPSLRLN